MIGLLTVVGLYLSYAHTRYVIAANSTASNCLQATYFLVDTWDKEVKAGQLAAFTMNVENKLYPVGRKWIKQVAATEGMTVNVTTEQTTISDGRVIKNNMEHTMAYLNISPDEIKQTTTLAAGQLFMMGDTKTTYDSRYWGPIQQADVIGVAYALF
ncbi:MULTISPECIES: signal peptidase I [Gammaproteobacteria]|nr:MULTISPECIES: signal peptidase I [Gammaproteobacteria]UHA80895.1 signal peptidase I [Escherichia coli]